MYKHVGYRVGVAERERGRAMMHTDISDLATGAKLCCCNVELCAINTIQYLIG